MHRRFAPLFIAVVIAASLAAPASAATPTAAPPVASAVSAPAAGGRPDTTDQYIVMLKNGSDPAAVVEKARKRDGVKADHTYDKAIRGFAAKLDKQQKSDLLADPNVVAIVPDEVVQLTQTIPTGVSRIGGRVSPIARINGIDERVDADVAIIDTGISSHPDLNIGGGYNCTSSDRTAWQDGNHHGTHVAGTIGALDNGFGVVGVAPGARVWGVRILNNDGYGLISWYICGLNWVLAQRDPTDASRPLFEAVNMSVTKAGTDDHNCGLTNNDPLHQAICRVVAGGITVVAAAGNEKHNAAANIPASYDEVITVSALADSDGKAGGLNGSHCGNWGLYDVDDTFADFSNYGGDVDIIAPGKCILSTWPGNTYVYLAGTSMAAPHVTGAVALYKSTRPNATPAEVREALRYLGNLNWNTATDPDATHEPLLDVSRIGALGTFALTPGAGAGIGTAGSGAAGSGAAAIPAVASGKTVSVPVTIVRASTFFERVKLAITSVPAGWTASVAPASLMGWSSNVGAVTVTASTDAPDGAYQIGVSGTNQGRTTTTMLSVDVINAPPTAQPPTAALIAGSIMNTSSIQVRVAWPAAVDPTTYIAGYEVQASKNDGPWEGTIARSAAQRDAVYTLDYQTNYRFRVRAMAANQNWSPWAEAAAVTRIAPFDDRNVAVVRSASWIRASNQWMWRQTESATRTAGANLKLTFTGGGIAVVARRSPTRGKAKIYLDGVYITTIDLSASVTQSRRVDFVRSFATPGTHTIAFVALGTGIHRYIGLDAFVVSR